MNFLLYLVTSLSVTCIVWCWVQMRKRNSQTWDSLLARLQPGWNAPVWTVADAADSSSPEALWQRVRGARGLCAMYRNAKVMQEMADYATRHNSGIDPTVLANLRSDALQIRFLVVAALIQYALHQLNEGICGNAWRAASLYQEMSGRMSGLLSAGAPMPQFVGAR